ncbi:SRPBCC domain-containing protein [Metabacillus litoralis]|jgi:uncharacterized protein YndB with AHSA1/START domain|uniref:SRPBCC domain-containing protein n=1 Tax=Metabacillus litoralis TaxID=152268 RepID=UPI00203CB385|nr:SRPBCC domain-containing protein [Metabacillus litoralis]MCM3654772.1 SRPBCC domain-containing protein [Metabacillus litoralis]
MNLETFEPRNGGIWGYIQQDKNGNRYGFHGVFQEVAKPERIINTFEFEGLPEKAVSDSYDRLDELLKRNFK